MKISTKKLKKMIREELFYREFYGKENIQEFWGKKKTAPKAPSKSPLAAAAESMKETVSSLWGLWDDPPRPDLLKKAQDLLKEIELAAAEEEKR